MKKISISQIDHEALKEELKTSLSKVATSGNWTDLKEKPLSLFANGGNASFLNGYSDNDFIKNSEPIYLSGDDIGIEEIYVDPINGEDTNESWSSLKPFKTINYALSKMPSYLRKIYRINIICNTEYDAVMENIKIIGYTGPGGIIINSLQNDDDFNSFEGVKNKTIIGLFGDHIIAHNNLNSGIIFNKLRLNKTSVPTSIKSNFCSVEFNSIYCLDETAIFSLELYKNLFVIFNNCYMEGNTNSHIFAEDVIHLSVKNSKFGFCNSAVVSNRSNVFKSEVTFEKVTNEF